MKKLAKYAVFLLIIFMGYRITTSLSSTVDNLDESSVQNYLSSLLEEDPAEIVIETEKPSEHAQAVIITPEVQPTSISDSISVTFIDVGQGDSILIQDHGQSMLIDTGYYSAFSNVEAVFEEKGVESIDVLVCTHPDADHIGSAASVVSYYGTETVYMPEIEKDSSSYGYLISALDTFDVTVIHPHTGDIIDFGTAKYEIIGPIANADYSDANSHSIIIRMINGKDTFLFTGDATGEETRDIFSSGVDVSAKVYKAAHHGSANDGCNNKEFISAVNPETIVISCGYGNDYGHPHKETMKMVGTYNLNVLRTDLQGTIRCISTGRGIEWDTEYSEDMRYGRQIAGN